jgi:hypothetical protein
MAGFDLGSIISQAAELTGTQTQQAQSQADLLSQNQDLANQQASAISDAGNLTAQAELVKQQGELATQQQRVTAANAFGTNVGSQSDVITSLGQNMRDTAVKLLDSQKKVSEIEANSDLFTNPAGWLTDLLTGDAARSERDALAAQFDTTQKIAQGLNQQTQSTAVTQNAISETLTAASIQQTADATKKLADAKALDAKIQGNAYGANAIQTMREVGAQNFNRSMQVYNQVTEDQRWQEGMALRKEQLAMTREARARGKQDDQYYVEAAEQINTYNRSAGLPEVTPNQTRATLNQSGKIGDIMRDRQASGFQIQESGSTARMFGDTASETIQKLSRDKPQLPASFAPASTVLKDSLDLAGQEVAKRIADPVNGAAFKTDKAAQARVYDDTVKNYAKQAQSNIQSGKGNPYEVVPIATVLQEVPGLGESNFGKAVLTSLTATGQPHPTPDLIVATAASALAKGDISFNEARDGLASFFENAVAIKNATGGFLQLGVPLQEGYKTKLQGFNRGFWDSLGSSLVISGGGLNAKAEAAQRESEIAAAKPLDLTKPTDVTLALTVMRSKNLTNQILKKTPE